MPALTQHTFDTIRSRQDAIIDGWLATLTAEGQDSRTSMRELTPQVREWADVRNVLQDFSRDRVQSGFNSAETANLIFSLKRPLFDPLQIAYADAPPQFAQELWVVSELLDTLGPHTVEAFKQTREDLIQRQQEEMLELSTPV